MFVAGGGGGGSGAGAGKHHECGRDGKLARAEDTGGMRDHRFAKRK
jgi:hypothetical protein